MMIKSKTLYLLFFLVFAMLPMHLLAKSKLAIGQDIYEKMQEAQLLVEAEKFKEADRVLSDILQGKRLNNYEKAQLYSMKGNVAYQQERFDDSLAQFKLAASLSDLPEGFLQATLRTLAQLSFMQDKLDDALLYAHKMIKTIPVPDSFSHMLLAQIYYKKEDFKSALENMLKAIDLERSQGSRPAENWLLILNAIYYSMGKFDQMVDVLKELIEVYPKQAYLVNLAAIYGQLEQTDKQLLLLEPLYDQGRLRRESELLNLANLMILHKVPYKGAKIIEQGFNQGVIKRTKRNLELLAQSWMLAAEDQKSVQYLAEAAKLSGEGIAYLRLGQTYIGLYQWQNAEDALATSLKLGGLGKKQGDAQLLLGMVRFYKKEYRSARKAFKDAAEIDGMEKLAQQWLNYLDQEREKEQAAEPNDG